MAFNRSMSGLQLILGTPNLFNCVRPLAAVEIKCGDIKCNGGADEILQGRLID